MPDPGSPSPTIVELANRSFHTVVDGLTKEGCPGWVAYAIGGLAWAGMVLLSTIKLVASFAIKEAVLPIALEIIKTITEIRTEGGKEFAAIAADVMGEFMGVQIDPGSIAPGQGPQAAAQRATQVGGAFLDMLQQSLAGQAPIDPADGATNA